MARALRLIAPGHPHHLLLRGHNRQAVFLDEQDRQEFAGALRDACLDHRLALHAYAFQAEQVQLLLTPGSEAAVSRAMQALGRRYVSQFNRRHARSGSLWEGRYRACVIDAERYLLPCMRFMEAPADRVGLASDLLAVGWTSLPHHLGQQRDPLITDHPAYWALGNTPFDREAAYRRFVTELPSEAERACLTRVLAQGGVLGDPDFLQRLGLQLQRDLSVRPRGRPKGSGSLKKTGPN